VAKTRRGAVNFWLVTVVIIAAYAAVMFFVVRGGSGDF